MSFDRLIRAAVAALFSLAAATSFAQSSTDTDGDGIPDAIEASVGKNPAVKDNDVFADAKLFVMQAYRDFMGREAATAEINTWTNAINGGTQTRASLVDALVGNPEHFDIAGPVTRLYLAYFLRSPDGGGYAFWNDAYRTGNPWTFIGISNFFVISAEFQQRYGSLTNEQFVDLIYQNVLNRKPDPSGYAFWTSELNSGRRTAGQVMADFSESPENKTAKAVEFKVNTLFLSMLKRAPTPSELANWVNQLRTATNAQALVSALLVLPEYRLRFLPPPANAKPVPTITSPAAGVLYRGGQTLSFAGSATDVEDGTIPASRLSWYAEFHHDTHTHPFQPVTAGGSGSVTIPTRGETSDNVWYRFHFKATDSAGQSTEIFRDVFPQKASVTLATVPAGLQLTLDGQPVTAPFTFTGVVGIERDLSAATQVLNGRRYQFASWSQGGAATQVISTPIANTTYTATFTDIGPANNPPTVSLTAPSTATVGTGVNLSATASDSDGTIAKVEFFEGATKLGEDTTAPFTFLWTPASAGSKSLTARATDNGGAATTSAAVNVTVSNPPNIPPTVTLSAPSTATVGTSVTLNASAADSDGTVAKVEFFEGATKLGEDATSPFSFSWTPASAGSKSLTARATDNGGAATTSTAVVVNVSDPAVDTTPPTASITAPANFASGLTGTLALNVSASDNVGVTVVEFQIDGIALPQDTTSPYSASIDTTQYAAGQHVLRARAKDAAGNTSAWASVTVSFGGAANKTAGFTLNDSWLTGLTDATALAVAPDGRIFVCEQGGAMRVVKSGALLSTPFASFTVDSVGERGLLGIAFHPSFASNGWIYVYHTVIQTGGGRNNRISRLTASGDVATGAAETIIDLPDLSGATNHNGGAMNFGTDGKLYVAVGDNATNPARAQDLSDPFGKILRFNDDGTVPPDNPYASVSGSTTLAKSIWASGLRNPFTFAVQAGTGRIFVNDVGQNTWEEVNDLTKAANFGWPNTEGPTSNPAFKTPTFAYKHALDVAGSGNFFTGCSIAGGAFYPSAGPFPANYRSNYYFADYCSGFVARMDLANGNSVSSFAKVGGNPVGMAVANDGALLVLKRNAIARITAP